VTTTTAGEDDTPTSTPETPTPDDDSDATPSSPTPTPDDDSDAPRRGGSGGGGSTGDAAGNEPSDVRLAVAGTSARLTYADVVPGSGDRATLQLANTGNGTGRLLVTNVTVRDEENGRSEAESAVDDTPDVGELSEHVHVVIEVHDADGTVTYLYGTESGARSLADIGESPGPEPAGVLAPGEEATVVVDWEIPAETGNEIQSDIATFDLTFGIRSEAS
jgi:hypothetical protein